MHKKRLMWLAIVSALLAVVMVACGSATPTATTEPTEAPPTETPEPAAAEETEEAVAMAVTDTATEEVVGGEAVAEAVLTEEVILEDTLIVTEEVVLTEEVIVTDTMIETEEIVLTEEMVVTEVVDVTAMAVETEEVILTQEVLQPAEVVVTEEVIVTEDMIVTEELVVTEVVPVTAVVIETEVVEVMEEVIETVEVILTDEVIVTEEMVVTDTVVETEVVVETEEIPVTEVMVETEEIVLTEEVPVTAVVTVEAEVAVTEDVEAVVDVETEEVVMTEEVVATEVIIVTEEMVVTEEMTIIEDVEVEATEEMMMTEEAMEPMGEMGPSVMVAPGNEIVVGFAAGLSGDGIAPLGIDEQRGVELAQEDRPTVTVGGIEFPVTLEIEDAQCSAEGGQAVANRFTSDENVVAVVGHMCSSSCTAAAPVYDASDYSMVSPSCTAPALTRSGFTSFNRVVPSDAQQGAVAAEFIYNELGITRIATIHDGSPYGEGLVDVLTERFTELGGEVVAADAVTVGDTDFRGLLEEFAAADPGLIYFGGFPAEGARIAEQRFDVGLEDVPMMGADGIQGTEIVDLAGDFAEGLYASKPVPASSEDLDAFLERYVDTYGEEPPAPFHANAYDAYNLILNGVEAVGYIDENGDLVVERAALREYIRSASLSGLTGDLTCDGTGECSSAEVDFFQVQDGTFVTLAPMGESGEAEAMATEEMAMTEEAEMMATEDMAMTEEAMMEEATATPSS